MSETACRYGESETTGPFRIAPPHAGDIVGYALHRAYDDHDTLPDDMIHMLDCLDRLD